MTTTIAVPMLLIAGFQLLRLALGATPTRTELCAANVTIALAAVILATT